MEALSSDEYVPARKKHPILYARAVSSSRPTNESRSVAAPEGAALRELVLKQAEYTQVQEQTKITSVAHKPRADDSTTESDSLIFLPLMTQALF